MNQVQQWARLRARTTCPLRRGADRKSTRLNSSHDQISYAVFCLKKKNTVYAINDATLFAVRGTRSRFDVDGNGQVSPQDVVTLITYLNAYGASEAPPPRDSGPYLDVTG